MAEKNNATCAICGTKYDMCNTCRSTKTYFPWRTVADSIECYKIYMIIYDYNYKKISKEKAKEKLGDCVIQKQFQPHNKTVINEIMDVSTNENVKIKTKKNVLNEKEKTTNNE